MKRVLFVLLVVSGAQVFALGDEGDDSGFGDDWGMDDKMPGPPMPGAPLPPGGGFPQPPGAPGSNQPPPPPPIEPPPAMGDHSYGAPSSSRGETGGGAVKFHLTGDKKKIERPKTWKEKIHGPRWITPEPRQK